MATAGVEFDTKKPTDRKGIEPTQVKSIKLLTALDNGSKNDGTGNDVQPGILYGKTYSFKVSAYTNGKPNDLKKIKWKFKYPSLSKDKWIIVNSTVTGDSYSIVMNEKDMCGRTIHVMAYINDCENEGYLKTWFHNRFRWFDRKIVDGQMDERVKEIWRIKQGGSSLCGMAVLYYALLKRDGGAYKKLAKNLFGTGEHTIGKYIIKPHDKALYMYDVKTTDSNFKAMAMFEIDWIVLATTRSKESLHSKFVYTGFEDGNIDMLKGVNWPDMLTRMCKEVEGFGPDVSHNLGFNAINNKKRLISARIYDYFSNSDLKN